MCEVLSEEKVHHVLSFLHVTFIESTWLFAKYNLSTFAQFKKTDSWAALNASGRNAKVGQLRKPSRVLILD